MRSTGRRPRPRRPARRAGQSSRSYPVSLPLLIQGLGSIGIFSSRAFLPAFATALLLRFGPHVPWLAQAGLLRHVRGVPTWFTSDTTLTVLGVLSILELIAER